MGEVGDTGAVAVSDRIVGDEAVPDLSLAKLALLGLGLFGLADAGDHPLCARRASRKSRKTATRLEFLSSSG